MKLYELLREYKQFHSLKRADYEGNIEVYFVF